MTDHVIEAEFKMSLQALQTAAERESVDQLPSGHLWTRHFDGYDLTPWGSIVIRRATFTQDGRKDSDGVHLHVV
jgi:hypothetical protein